MKTLIPLLFALVLPVSAELPAEAQKLVEVREREIHKLNVAYLQRLDTLLADYRAKGDAKAVEAIEKLVAEVEVEEGKAAAEKKDGGKTTDPLAALVGIWQRDSDKRLFHISDAKAGSFNGDQPFTMEWDSAKDRVTVISAQWVNYFWLSRDPNVMTGGYEQGGRTVRYKMKRIK